MVRVRKRRKMMKRLMTPDTVAQVCLASIDQTLVNNPHGVSEDPLSQPPLDEFSNNHCSQPDCWVDVDGQEPDLHDGTDHESESDSECRVPPSGTLRNQDHNVLDDGEEIPGGDLCNLGHNIDSFFHQGHDDTQGVPPPSPENLSTDEAADANTGLHTPLPSGTLPFLTKDKSISLDDQDSAMLDLVQLCQDAGTPLWFFDKLMTTLRRHGKKKGFSVKKATKRETFVEKLRKKISCPRPEIVSVGSSQHQVPRFSLLEQILDLLESRIFDDLGNICANEAASRRFHMYEPSDEDKNVEVCATGWYRKTHLEFVKVKEKQYLLPLIFYVDETGTDAFQRYPLEPFMFTLGNIRREMREKASSWRHAGFIPKVGKFSDATAGLQAYHDCLAVILADLEELQKNPPLVTINLGGIKQEVRLILQVAFVMGDQMSQDKLCGRKKANGGGAGRTHRRCMCSSPKASDTCVSCSPLTESTVDIITTLRDISFEGRDESIEKSNLRLHYPSRNRNGTKTDDHKNALKFIDRRAGLAAAILGKTYTLHPIRNAFEGIGFGCNKAGIHTATLDDPLHFCNSGLFMYMGEIGYLGMTATERKGFEKVVQTQVCGTRSTIRNEYPRGRYANGFTNMTLLTADEKVGMAFTMVLALHNDSLKEQMDKVFDRQQKKYMTFYTNKDRISNFPTTTDPSLDMTAEEKKKRVKQPIPAPPSEIELFPIRDDVYFAKRWNQRNTDATVWPRTDGSVDFILHHLNRHGFGFLLNEQYDKLQLEYLLSDAWTFLHKVQDNVNSYPEIPGYDIPASHMRDDWKNTAIKKYYKDRMFCVVPTNGECAGSEVMIVDSVIPSEEQALAASAIDSSESEAMIDDFVLPDKEEAVLAEWNEDDTESEAMIMIDSSESEAMIDDLVLPDEEGAVLAELNEDDTESEAMIDQSVQPESEAGMNTVATGGNPGKSRKTKSTKAPQETNSDLRAIIFHHLRVDGLVQKHHRKKPKRKGNGIDSAVLCDVHTYVDFLELSLCMHAYLHYSSELPFEVRSDLPVFRKGMVEFIRLYSLYFYRGDCTVDSDTCKIHSFLHLIANTPEFGDPMQYESGKGERGLKEWAKSVSRTAQKTGLDVFIYQTVMRVADRLLLAKASDMLERHNLAIRSKLMNGSTVDAREDQIACCPVKKRKHPHFRYYLGTRKLFPISVDGKMSNEETTIGPKTISAQVISALHRFEKDMVFVNIWSDLEFLPCETRPQSQKFRCSGSLDKFGSFFDWANINFDVTNDEGESEVMDAPGKLLAFYQDSDGEECAVFHSVRWSTGTETTLGNTRLVTNYQREFQKGSGWPSLRKCKVNDIRQPLYVIERLKDEDPVPKRTVSLSERKKYVVSVCLLRGDWAMEFYDWAKEIESSSP